MGDIKRVLALTATAIVLMAVAGVLGVACGRRSVTADPQVIEPPAREVRQEDGSMVLERRPTGTTEGVPTHQIPSNSKVVRDVEVVVQPKPTPVKCPDPAPVTVRVSLVEAKDGTSRVVASSPDGEVLGGMDLPRPRTVPRPPLNTLGLSVGLPGNYVGAYYSRAVGPLDIGAEVGLRTSPVGVVPPGPEVRVRVGVRF